MYMHTHRDSPEEKDGPSPVLMLRNLKEAVRKEDVSWRDLTFTIHSLYPHPNLLLIITLPLLGFPMAVLDIQRIDF